MRVKFLRPIRVYPDGIHPFTAEAGQEHDLPQHLAEALIRDVYAEEPEEPVKGDIEEDDSEVSATSRQSELAGAETKEVKDTKQQKSK